MTASGPSRARLRALAWAVCALTVTPALASLVLAIADPNYAALSAVVFSAFALLWLRERVL